MPPLRPALGDDHGLLLRKLGRELAARLAASLATTRAEVAAVDLEEAVTIAADYGRVAAAGDISLNRTAERFLRGRADFLREIVVAARRGGLDAVEASDLLGQAVRAIDRLLVAVATGHAEAAIHECPEPAGGRWSSSLLNYPSEM